jgi:hypothetical protein
MNELVERYRRTYEKVNDGECPKVRYCGNGWYQVGEMKVRRRKLEQMAQQLEWQAEGDELGYGDIFLSQGGQYINPIDNVHRSE